MPNDLFERYDFGDLLGVGTVGTIYAATDKETGQRVAIKRLHPRVSANPMIRARFKREMKILERLRHPNIVQYMGGGNEDESLYYVMELVNGGTVKLLLESGGPIPWPVAVDLAIQICSALQCAHNHGVVHRDLKPGNLFLTTNGEVKLGDFGIARDLNQADLTEEGFTVGTHAYMAPEQIRGEKSVSAKADLYALGCCLFEILTDRKPFSGDNYAKLFDQHLKSPPPRVKEFVSDLPHQLDTTIDELLAKDPEERPFNARFVQAVMLRLARESELNRGEPDKTAAREMLRTRIRARHQNPPEPEIKLARLIVPIILLIAGIVIATFWNS